MSEEVVAVCRHNWPGHQPDLRSERGAILIFVGLAVLMLTAFSAFVLDYGIMWMSRRQAQNAADAGALAGAVARMRDESADPPAANGAAYNSAYNAALANQVLGQAPGVVVSWTCPSWLPAGTRCVRVDTHRDGTNSSVVLPVYFANLLGVTSQQVRATATARLASGNSVRCLLPFGVIDRWADNFDDDVDTTYFATDGANGTAGWTPNDDYQPTASPADVYIGPYGQNPAHTGWRLSTDFGRQLILKDGSPGNYSAGWANTVLLPGSIGYNDVGDDILTCNEQPVGIATAANTCPVSDYPNGCIDVQTGVGQGQIRLNIEALVASDDGAGWVDPDGFAGPTPGSVVGGGGMDSPRVRPIAIVDIAHYDAQGCSGSTCVAKVANIIGFFVEGMCNDVMAGPGLDPGLACDDPTKDVVGRIVTLPASYVTGVGNVDDTAAFLQIVTLVQ
jgi:Flp pilus assembly protein TadG